MKVALNINNTLNSFTYWDLYWKEVNIPIWGTIYNITNYFHQNMVCCNDNINLNRIEQGMSNVFKKDDFF